MEILEQMFQNRLLYYSSGWLQNGNFGSFKCYVLEVCEE